jgi:hypothetical protein
MRTACLFSRPESKRSLASPRGAWRYNIKMEWFKVTQDFELLVAVKEGAFLDQPMDC